MVIAYPREESLHGLIAAASILGLGFNSREEAVASIETSFPTTGGQKSEKYQPGVHFATRRLRDWVGLAETVRRFQRVMQQVVVAAIVLFYSTNAVAAAIRTLVGA